ncbi:SDR family oxidoreductase [Spirosoma jeollabukense]
MNQGITGKIPIHHFDQPEEIAKVVLFFASDDSSFIVGAELITDDGKRFENMRPMARSYI